MDRKIITDKEAREAGVKRQVYQDWFDLMQALWTSQIAFFRTMKEDVNYFPIQHENEIYIGKRFSIRALMVNDSYIKAQLWQQNIQLAEFRYFGNTGVICKCFRDLIKTYT